MAEVTDLYPILKAYSAKIKSPYIDIDPFLEYLERYAARKAQDRSEWNKWLGNKGVQFWSELSLLVESDKCVLMESNAGGQVYIPSYFTTLLREFYLDPDKIADIPFPSEESLGVTIPENQIKIIYLTNDLKTFLEKPEEAAEDARSSPWQVIKLIFPEGCGSALLLHTMMPGMFLEITMLKIRNYLNTRGNKEFILHKLTPQFQGKEKYLRDILDQAIVRPTECMNSIKQAGDFSYIFWNNFCGLVKSDITKRNETLSEDMAVIQAVHIIEICNGFFRARAVKIREKEIAFRNLETCMGKPPGFFTKDEITKFHTDKGFPLIGMFTLQELDDYIKKVITESKNNALPEWFMVNGKKGVQWYLKKEKYLSICARLLVSTRPLIKKEISKRWTKLLREYSKESAMEKDSEFERLLNNLTSALCPPLASMLADPKLQWTYEETERAKINIHSSMRIFKMGKLLPLSALYAIRRKDLVTDTKYLLPFWYSFPIISAIAAFFFRLTRKKGKKRIQESIEIEETLEGKAKTVKELHDIADMITAALVPAGQTMDTHMDELENRWNKLIGVNSRQNLTIDVQSLVRDNLRKMIKVHKAKKITRDSIHESVSRIITGTPALHGMSNQDSLCRYMELYMVQLLSNVK